MYRFLLFLKAIHVVLLFIILELTAGYFFFRSNPYQRAVAINTTNQAIGFMHRQTSSVNNFFNLSSINRDLADENARLREELSRMKAAEKDTLVSSQTISDEYIAARVINNSTAGQNNFITINKGSADGIENEMALLNDKGIVGYILDCSAHHSVALSILNYRDFRTSGRLKDSDNTGTISWDGRDYRVVQITGLPKYAPIEIGDTITTTQYSNLFPDNYPVGTVRDFTLSNGTSYNANIELFADMSQLKYVYAVKNPLQRERAELENNNIIP